jgi:hypothetical protein
VSEELPITADAAIRAYLFAIGFTLVLIEIVKKGDYKRRICTENTQLQQPPLSTLQLSPLLPSYNCAEETFPDYTDRRYGMFVLVFPTVIQPKEIKLNAHGANLPKWERYPCLGLAQSSG